MPDFPSTLLPDGFGTAISVANPASGPAEEFIITAAQPNGSAVWFGANAGIFIPFILHRQAVATQMTHQNGTVVSGNVDVGIFDERGKLIVSKGTVAQAGTSTIQVHDITDTELAPNVYFMGMSMDNNTGTVLRSSLSAQLLRAAGVEVMASAFVLPSTVTFAVPTLAFCPNLAVHFVGAGGAV